MDTKKKPRGRPALGRKAHTLAVTIKLSAEEMTILDRRRGNRPRSEWLRQALTQGGK